VNQPIGTVGEDDWMAKMMLNIMMVFGSIESLDGGVMGR